MSRFDWIEEFVLGLAEAHVDLHDITSDCCNAPVRAMDVEIADWGMVAKVASQNGLRWCGVWGDHRGAFISMAALLERAGDYLLLRTDLATSGPVLPSHTPWFAAADRMERQLQDMLGVAFLDHPDERRWLRHRAWSENDYPLRSDFPVAGKALHSPTPPDGDYAFRKAQGSAVYEIPVGPVHAGVIEPGHFRFQAVGEHILQLEEHLGYVHKGIEKIAVGRDARGLARLAARVSGDTTVAHGWAACQAMERAQGVAVPLRADYLRALMAERERVANHLGDIGAICTDVGFSFAHLQCGRLREKWQRRSHELFGHRFMMDCILPGGVSHDLDQPACENLRNDISKLQKELERIFDIIDDTPSLSDRLITTGYLSAATARALGCLGYVGRASGVDKDVRRDTPYTPYDRLSVSVPASDLGDVATRLKIRADEVLVSLQLQLQILHEMPAGEITTAWPEPPVEAEGLGIVEGWRGEIVCYVRFDESGQIARFFPRDPSWFNWPALELAVLGNIVPDFPVCNKSVNGSYSGHDL